MLNQFFLNISRIIDNINTELFFRKHSTIRLDCPVLQANNLIEFTIRMNYFRIKFHKNSTTFKGCRVHRQMFVCAHTRTHKHKIQMFSQLGPNSGTIGVVSTYGEKRENAKIKQACNKSFFFFVLKLLLNNILLLYCHLSKI